ncbi:hypothetical protein [Nocardia mexicana]|uniref:Uncharacterized protein n=1 Tax=Nocardia mexicana TaxID=279262 RepID=A0A370H6N0_9NOCA|nr:hypothetical protein [Nocardia mexicana]RDI51142.1 hypothetical protein DFR68_105620 [Nocardia mexicana]
MGGTGEGRGRETHSRNDRIARHRSRGEAERPLLSLAGLLSFGLVSGVFLAVSRFPQRGVGALATIVPGPGRRLTLHGRDVVEYRGDVWGGMKNAAG